MKTNQSDALIEKAKTKVSESSGIIYESIPGFSQYEFNGIIIRNKKKKNILSLKTGTRKYQLLHDNGTRPTLTKDEIRELMPKSSIKPLKPKKISADKIKKRPEKEKKIFNSIIPIENLDEIKSKKGVSKIVNGEMKRHRKHYELSLLGLNKKEIGTLTGATESNIGRDLLFYKTGKLSV